MRKNPSKEQEEIVLKKQGKQNLNDDLQQEQRNEQKERRHKLIQKDFEKFIDENKLIHQQRQLRLPGINLVKDQYFCEKRQISQQHNFFQHNESIILEYFNKIIKQDQHSQQVAKGMIHNMQVSSVKVNVPNLADLHQDKISFSDDVLLDRLGNQNNKNQQLENEKLQLWQQKEFELTLKWQSEKSLKNFLKKQLKELIKVVDKQQIENDKLKLLQQQNLEKLDIIVQKMAVIQIDKNNVQTDHNKCNEKVKDLEDQNKNLNLDISNFQLNHQKILKEMEQRNNKYNQINNDYQEEKKNKGLLEVHMKELENKNNQMREQINRIRKQLGEQKKEKEEIKQKLKNTIELLDEVQKQNENFSEKIKILKKDFQVEDNEIEEQISQDQIDESLMIESMQEHQDELNDEIQNKRRTRSQTGKVQPKYSKGQLIQVEDDNSEEKEIIDWGSQDTYSQDQFFKTYKGVNSCRRIYQLHIMKFHTTEEIINFYCGKYTFKLKNLLIFNYEKKLSIIVISFHGFYQCNRSVFLENFGEEFVIASLKQTKQDLIIIGNFCTVQHNRQNFKKYIEPPFTVKGITSEFKKYVMKGTALCFIYHNVGEFDMFIKALNNKCKSLKIIQKKEPKKKKKQYVGIKDVKKEIILTNYNNGEEVLLIIVFDLQEARTLITKDIFQNVNGCELNQVRVHQCSKPLAARIKQLIQRKDNYEKTLITWYTKKGTIKVETVKEKKEKFEDFFQIQQQEDENIGEQKVQNEINDQDNMKGQKEDEKQ